ETVIISAKIKGLTSQESAKVLVTSDDGRQKDYPVALLFNEQSNRFCATIGEVGGLKESFSYRIEAGDAKSLDYRIEVRTGPTMFVESVEYIPPAYTGIPVQLVKNPDSISGVEGTLCRIVARANLPIATAQLDLFRKASSAENAAALVAEGDGKIEKIKSIPMVVRDGNLAVGELTLELNTQRKRQRFSHYEVRFVSKEGDESGNPNRAEIEIIPDLKPEIEIMLPQEKVVEVPVNQSEKIAISAVDPDYGLTAIVLVAENRGNRLFEKRLFKSNSPAGTEGKQRVTFPFQPNRLGLKAGDEVVWHVRAEDNRAVGDNQTLLPNRQRTDNYRFVITPPLKKNLKDQPNPDQPNPDQPNPDQKEPGRPGQDSHTEDGAEQPSPGRSDSQEPEESKPNKQGKQGGDSGQGKPASSPDQKMDNSQRNAGSKGGEPSESQSQPSSKGSRQKSKLKNGKSENQAANPGEARAENGEQPNGESSDSAAGNQQPSAEKAVPNSRNSTTKTDQQPGTESGQSSAGEDQNSQSTQGDQSSGNGRKPANSREAFERLKNYFEKKQGEDLTQDNLGRDSVERTDQGVSQPDRNQSEKSGPSDSKPKSPDSGRGKKSSSKEATPGDSPAPGQPKKNKGSREQGDSQGTSRGDSGASELKSSKPTQSNSQKNSRGPKAKDEAVKESSSKSEGNRKEKGASGKEIPEKQTDQNSSNTDFPRKHSGGNSGEVDSSQKSDSNSKPRTVPKRPGGPADRPDKANLDYAKKTTDLVLEKLKKKSNRTDSELLKELNWTQEELDEFAKRWESMRQKANSGSKRDESRFEQALRSLGLKDSKLSTDAQELRDDDRTGYRQKSGTRKVPTEFAKKFRAIQKSQRTAKSQDD
ncbi:MAG: hypothetical protein VX438_08525, partial [Planctomycetota bacterium]|nr:hypothetical protein [Planctomycetota bacterium]